MFGFSGQTTARAVRTSSRISVMGLKLYWWHLTAGWTKGWKCSRCLDLMQVSMHCSNNVLFLSLVYILCMITGMGAASLHRSTAVDEAFCIVAYTYTSHSGILIFSALPFKAKFLWLGRGRDVGCRRRHPPDSIWIWWLTLLQKLSRLQDPAPLGIAGAGWDRYVGLLWP